MSRYLRAAALTIMLGVVCFPRSVMAQELRLAVVDIETLTFMSDEGKAVNDKLKKRFDEITAIMQKAQKEIEDKETQLRTQDRALSAAAKNTLTRDIANLKKDFDRKKQDYETELAALQDDLIDPVAGKAQAMLQKYIKEKNYTMVLDLSAQEGNIVWSNPANDITQAVIKLLNDEYEKVTPAAATPAAARPAGAPAATGTTRAPAGAIPAAPATNR